LLIFYIRGDCGIYGDGKRYSSVAGIEDGELRGRGGEWRSIDCIFSAPLTSIIVQKKNINICPKVYVKNINIKKILKFYTFIAF
jgi:hypothetical protein